MGISQKCLKRKLCFKRKLTEYFKEMMNVDKQQATVTYFGNKKTQ